MSIDKHTLHPASPSYHVGTPALNAHLEDVRKRVDGMQRNSKNGAPRELPTIKSTPQQPQESKS